MSGGDITFTVYGTPVPQGSKSAFVVAGRAVIAESGRARLKPYRASLADAAAQAMNGAELLTGALSLSLELYFPRPKSHYGRGQNASVLRGDAADYVSTRPDASKVARAVEDALTGVVYRDDAQVAELYVTKSYGNPPRTVASVRVLAS